MRQWILVGLLVSGLGGCSDETEIVGEPEAELPDVPPPGEELTVAGPTDPEMGTLAEALGFDFTAFARKVAGASERGRAAGALGCVLPAPSRSVTSQLRAPSAVAFDDMDAFVTHELGLVGKPEVIKCGGSKECGPLYLWLVNEIDPRMTHPLLDLARLTDYLTGADTQVTVWWRNKAAPVIAMHGVREGRLLGMAWFGEPRVCGR